MFICKYCGKFMLSLNEAHDHCELKHRDALTKLEDTLKDMLTFNRFDVRWEQKEKGLNVSIDNIFIKEIEQLYQEVVVNGFLSDKEIYDIAYPIIKNYVENLRNENNLSDAINNHYAIWNSPFIENKENDLKTTMQWFAYIILSEIFYRGSSETISPEETKSLIEELTIGYDFTPEDICVAITIVLQKKHPEILKFEEYNNEIKDAIVEVVMANINLFNVIIDDINLIEFNISVTDFLKSRLMTDVFKHYVLQCANNETKPVLKAPEDIIIAAREYVTWIEEGVFMYEERITSEWVGGRNGMSIRLAKGLYYHTGQSKGHKVETSTMEYQGLGDLVLTNKNLIFNSNLRSLKIPISSIISLIPSEDGFEIRTQRNKKGIVFQGSLIDTAHLINVMSNFS